MSPSALATPTGTRNRMSIPIEVKLNPVSRNNRNAFDFHDSQVQATSSNEYEVESGPLIQNTGGVEHDFPRTPPPHLYLPIMSRGRHDNSSPPYLPTLHSLPSSTIHLEPRRSATWAFESSVKTVMTSSPRDVVAESEAAVRYGATEASGKKCQEFVPIMELQRARPVDDEIDYIEDADSDASSLSSSPWQLQADTTNIFRIERPLKSAPPVRLLLTKGETARQLWLRSAPPLCISTSEDSSSTVSSTCDDEKGGNEHYRPNEHHYKYSSSSARRKSYVSRPGGSIASDVESTDRGRRLREALDLLMEVLTPECCAQHMRVGNPNHTASGPLKPWNVLLAVPQPQSSSSRLRGCYL